MGFLVTRQLESVNTMVKSCAIESGHHRIEAQVLVDGSIGVLCHQSTRRIRVRLSMHLKRGVRGAEKVVLSHNVSVVVVETMAQWYLQAQAPGEVGDEEEKAASWQRQRIRLMRRQGLAAGARPRVGRATSARTSSFSPVHSS